MTVCICNTLWSLSSIGIILLSYYFTSTFVWTLLIGSQIVLALFVAISDNQNHCDNHKKCLKDGFGVSFLFVILAAVVTLLSTGLQYGYTSTYCYFRECCNDNWISSNISGLSLELNQRLYGQHLVIDPIVKHLRSNVEGKPKKATVFSLHGLPGTGKNFVTSMLVDHMYVKGMDSNYVHLLSATKDFPHESMLEEYKETLKSQIQTAGKECPRSLVIIDEMDKLLPGLIDVIRPFIDYYDQVEGVDYKNFLLILLSNIGGDKIGEHAVQNYDQGNERRKLKLKDMEEVIRIASLHDPNGLVNSTLVRNSLITAYIPFLPLERTHVEKCIIDGLYSRGYYKYGYQVDYETVKLIADEMMFFPNSTKTFSTTGCKRVLEKIDLIMQEDA